MTNFLELAGQFEIQLSANFEFELLELHYRPHSFGSGMKADRIKGRAVKIIFDGKDYMVELLVSAKHLKYPCTAWVTTFIGKPADFIENGLTELKKTLAL